MILRRLERLELLVPDVADTSAKERLIERLERIRATCPVDCGGSHLSVDELVERLRDRAAQVRGGQR